MPSAGPVRSATGADQEWLSTVAVAEPAVAVACALVERCAGHADAAPAETLRAIDLPVGVRNERLWELRRATFGERLDVVVECTACGEKLDTSLTVRELTGHSTVLARDPATPHTADIDGMQVTFRLATGRDQLAVADEPDPARSLWRRLVVDVDGTPPTALDDDTVDTSIEALGDELAKSDPSADTVLAMACAACGADVAAELDAFAYLREELLAGSEAWLQEIHVLASCYHWSEAEILSLPIERRRAYLDLIADGVPR